jgi:cold shock CspA family protein
MDSVMLTTLVSIGTVLFSCLTLPLRCAYCYVRQGDKPEIFCSYLIAEDERNCNVPERPEYANQCALRNELHKQWSATRATAAEMMRLPDIAAEHVIATVEFFDHFRGFGFVEVPSLKDKAFLHARTLEQYGIRDLRDGDEILCDVVRSSKGLVVARVKTVCPLQTKTAHAIVVKLLSERAYGFVQIQETGTDAFSTIMC